MSQEEIRIPAPVLPVTSQRNQSKKMILFLQTSVNSSTKSSKNNIPANSIELYDSTKIMRQNCWPTRNHITILSYRKDS